MIKIRAFAAADIPLIVEKQRQLNQLHRQLNRRFYAPSKAASVEFSSYIARRLKDKDFKIFVAEESGLVIGYVMGWVRLRPPLYERRKVGYLANIFVDEAARGGGVGGRLYRRLEKWFKTKDVNFIEATAYAGNSDTLDAFRSYGLRDLSVTFYKEPRGK
jgi:GNAT superfamily N-acetyltransferase